MLFEWLDNSNLAKCMLLQGSTQNTVIVKKVYLPVYLVLGEDTIFVYVIWFWYDLFIYYMNGHRRYHPSMHIIACT